MDIDARMAKRMAQVWHIEQKPYYRPGLAEQPDPSAQTCSTRMWKYKMNVWVQTLKRAHARDQDQQPPHEEDPAPM